MADASKRFDDLLRAATAGTDDTGRGLFISSGRVAGRRQETVAGFEAVHDVIQPQLQVVGERLGLHPLEREILAIAAAPHLDAEVERAVAYLNDDASQGNVTVGVLAAVLGVPIHDPALSTALTAGAAARLGAIAVHGPGAMPRRFVVPDPVVLQALTGSALSDSSLTPLLMHPVPVPTADATDLATMIDGQPLFAHLWIEAGGSGVSVAATAMQMLGRDLVALDLEAAGTDVASIVRRGVRLAALRAAGLYLEPAGLVADEPASIDAVIAAPTPVMLGDRAPWNPAAAPYMPIRGAARALDRPTRVEVWEDQLDGADVAEGLDVDDVAGPWPLTPEQIRLAAQAAITDAMGRGRAVADEHVRAGVRAQNLTRLTRLATRVAPAADFGDLVLDDSSVAELRSLLDRVEHRDQVVGAWGFGGGRGIQRGVTALFAGPPGTGKTLAAEVLASALDADLYVVDLARIVDKYIGETEKNLDGLFREAEGLRCVLLFDEADALFGKRTGVSDARDRYANIETAYLLQRMEQFQGVAVLASNLRGNLDDAFTRRFDTVLTFPTPDAAARERLWEVHLRTDAPLADDVDVAALAAHWELSGGDIRNAALSAGFAAAADKGVITQAHLEQALERELHKIGRLVRRSGPSSR